MKKHQSYLILLLAALLFCGPADAKVTNYLGFSLNGGEWSLMAQQSAYGLSIGAGGGLAFHYELQAGPEYGKTRFLFNVGAGAIAGTTGFNQAVSSGVTLPGQRDLSGDLFDYVYELDNRRDSYNNVAVQVPLLFGFQHNKFYMLVGAKVNYSLWTKTASTAMLTTYGHYVEHADLYNQPEYQFFTGLPVKGGVRTRFNLDVCASLEIGGRLGFITDAVGFDVPKRTTELRLAAFVDYGLLDLHIAGSADALEAPKAYDTDPTSDAYVYKTTSMVDNLVMNDIMSTTGFARSVNSLTVGLKFTVLFQLPERGQCLLCRDNYWGLTGMDAGRGGLQYEE